MTRTEAPLVHKVLLVDDDDAVRDMMIVGLEHKGFEVVAVVNAMRHSQPDALTLLVSGREKHVEALPVHEAVPNSDPTPAVSAMASAPQNVTRIAPIVTPAPPARAAKPPRSARNTSEDPETKGINIAGGTVAVTRRGMAAPTAKQAADANAA